MLPKAKSQELIRKNKWYVQGGEARFVYMTLPTSVAVNQLNDTHKKNYEMILNHCKNGYGNWMLVESGLNNFSEFILNKQLKNPTYISQLYKKWQKRIKTFNDTLKLIDKTDFSGLKDDALLKLYLKFEKAYMDVWKNFVFIDTFDLRWDALVNEVINKYYPGKLNESDIKSALLPTDISYSLKERLGSLEIAKQVISAKKDKIMKFYRTYEDAFYSSDKLEKFLIQLKKHREKYFWYKNNYGHIENLNDDSFFMTLREILANEDVKAEIKKIQNIKKENQRLRNSVYKKHKIPKKLKIIFNLLSKLTDYRDIRKENTCKGNAYMKQFLEEFSKRTKIRLDLLENMFFEEIHTIFKNKTLEKLLKKRNKEVFMFMKVKEKPVIYTGADARNLMILIEKNLLKQHTEIRGITASPGKAAGKVKIIQKTHDIINFKDGDILVSSMTRPEMVIAMEKAAAIITDEGGITSHAAIVSRELGIPCVIGTHVATRLLRDNDLVEVDADKGVVRKI